MEVAEQCRVPAVVPVKSLDTGENIQWWSVCGMVPVADIVPVYAAL